MEEQTTKARYNNTATSESVAAKYLTYTYYENVLYSGRYTKLVPHTGSTFIVYFLE